MNYDLEQRTTNFAEDIISFSLTIPRNAITLPLISQLVRSGTSIGANYCEANGASSKKDFRNKIFICKKEAKETCYWLNLLKGALAENRNSKIESLYQESQELVKIFSKIAHSSKDSN